MFSFPTFSYTLHPSLLITVAALLDTVFSIVNCLCYQELTLFSTDLYLNSVTLHPSLLTAVATLLDTDVGDLRLTQSDVWAKYGVANGSGDTDAAADVAAADVATTTTTTATTTATTATATATKKSNNMDQRIHCDYPNHMLTHPTPWEDPSAGRYCCCLFFCCVFFSFLLVFVAHAIRYPFT
jgi:hypothetical protein